MKVGDKLICKNIYDVNLTINKTYIITEVDVIGIMKHEIVIINDDNGHKMMFVNVERERSHKYRMYDFFYTVEELRLYKLKTIL